METVVLGFDVDGTLLNGDDVAAEDIRTLLRILHGFLNVRIVVWSGSGESYARQRARQIHIEHWVDEYAAKGAVRVDIAVDDVGTTNLAHFNLICKGEALPDEVV